MSFDEEASPGRTRLTVLSGPSGVGKDRVIDLIRARHPEVWLSVSVTTRPPREYEVDGYHYKFVDRAEFSRLAAEGQLLEWADFAGNLYGTPRGPVEEQLAKGQPALLKIDLQGARQVRESMPGALLIFLAPPSWDELKRRLTNRGTEDAATIRHRLEHAREELAAVADFDVTVVNDEAERAAEELVGLLGYRDKTPVTHRRYRG